ncbi:MAG: actin-binding WH2 domain-containing protein [Xenococcaceae cyanobacterium]
MNYFEILMQLLRDRQNFLLEIDRGLKLDKKSISLLVCSSLFLAFYGAIIGSFSSWLQMLSSAIKLPALYLLTMIICLPTLYFFDIISGSKRTFGQYLALLLATMSIISVMLFGFAPVTIFFRLSANDYNFFRLLNVAIFAITGWIGINFFYQSILSVTNQEIDNPKNHNSIIKAWLFLYAFVGSQLAWTLRPFFSRPDEPFAFFREIESNFYIEVIKIIGQVLGWTI